MYAIEKWLIYYNAAKEYYEKNNNLDIPTNYSINGLNLGTWIVRQRTRKDKLDNHKTNLLNKIGMIWDYRAYHWNKQYELVKQYYETYGDLELPINYTVDGYNLYKWLGTQNLSYFDGKLSKERIKLLEDLGIKWHKQPDWDEMYEYAKIFYQTYGHLRVPQRYMVDGNNLYNWINRQRNKFKQNILGKERIALLNKIGMIWDMHQDDAKWLECFKIAKEYYETYGNLEIPVDYTVGEHNIYVWLQNQKYLYNSNELSNSRIEKLNTIEMIWNKHLYNWFKYYNLAKKFYEINGHLDIKRDYEDGQMKVGQWITRQRERKASLSAKQIELLDNIAMIWDYRKYRLLNNEVTKIELKVKRKKLEQILYTVLEECDFDQEIIEEEFIRKLQ